MFSRATGASFAFLACLVVQDGARAQQSGAVNYAELFQSLDANDDKVITRGEVPEPARAAFDRLAKLTDSNHDGKIDQQEYRNLLAQARDSALSAVPRTAGSFAAADKNGDGKIARDEFTGLPGMFLRADANGDGFLTPEEATRFRDAAASGKLPGRNQFGPRFQAMDKNGDHKLSREEFTGLPANFDRMDTDKNGFLTPSEIRKFFLANPPATKKAQTAPPEKPTADAK